MFGETSLDWANKPNSWGSHRAHFPTHDLRYGSQRPNGENLRLAWRLPPPKVRRCGAVAKRLGLPGSLMGY